MTSDVQQVQNGLNLALRLLLRSPFIVFGSMIMAFTIDVRCALIFAVAIPVLSVVVFGIMLVSIPLFRKVQAALDKVLGLTRENLTGVRVIRAFCKEDREVGKFEEANEALTKINLFVGRISAVMNPATYFLINLATIYLIREGAVRVNMGGIQQGQVVALYNYMAQMIIELIKLASLIISINKALACADRIENILEVKPGMDYPQGDSTVPSADGETAPAAAKAGCGDEEKAPAVEFRSVSFTYEGGGAPALTGITFTVRKGQTVGIIGGTGSGKTTLVNLIPRVRSALFRRELYCLKEPSGTTCVSEIRTLRMRISGRLWKPRRRKKLWRASKASWTRRSNRTAATSPAVRSRGLRLRARLSGIRKSSLWMTARARWILRPTRGCGRQSMISKGA